MNHDELRQQIAFVEWLQFVGIQYFNHSPNEGKRTAQEGNKLKRMGMSKGFPDLQIPIPIKGKHGLFIEFKSENGRLTPEQKKWIAYLNEQGYVAAVARSFDEARQITMEYICDDER